MRITRACHCTQHFYMVAGMASTLLTEPALTSVTFIVCFCWLLPVIMICNAGTLSVCWHSGFVALALVLEPYSSWWDCILVLLHKFICFSHTHKPRMEEISILRHVSYMPGWLCSLICFCRLLIRDAEFFEKQSLRLFGNGGIDDLKPKSQFLAFMWALLGGLCVSTSFVFFS